MTLDHILLLWNIGQLLPQPLQVSDLQRELRESFQPDLVQHKGCYSSAPQGRVAQAGARESLACSPLTKG